jgi:hypothetical protein
MNLKLTPLKRKKLRGDLNRYSFFRDKNGRVILCRKPVENWILWEEIRKEYEGIGFFRLGGEIRRRSAIEQGKLGCEWAARGLPVLAPVKFSATRGWYPFINGVSYSQWLTSGGVLSKIIDLYIDSVVKAHQNNIVYGDRWGPNTMVVDDTTIVHFDFDISLEGFPAKEFELAQAMYYTLCFSSRKDLISQYLTWRLSLIKRSGQYNWEVLSKLIEGHYRHFTSTKYGCKKRLILNDDVEGVKDRR